MTIYPWGSGIADVRYFTPQILMPSELKGLEDAKGYVPQALTLEGAVKSIELTMQDAEPGIYFAGNPLSDTYGKWLVALKAAGWQQVPGCALNRVWGGHEYWKGPGSKHPDVKNEYSKSLFKHPWYSEDGFQKWIHAFWHVVPGRTKPVEWDFTSKTRNLSASSGDADLRSGKGSLWHINYGGSSRMLAKYSRDGKPAWCPNFGRLSKSCGIAMGYGLPACGADLDEEFFTIAAVESGKKFPKGWNVFTEYAGMQFAHNLAKLSTAQLPCPHSMKV